MQATMAMQQAMEQYVMLDFANVLLEQCWDICYDRNLTRAELAAGAVPEAKDHKMDACARKCVARHFEAMKLMQESREMQAAGEMGM